MFWPLPTKLIFPVQRGSYSKPHIWSPTSHPQKNQTNIQTNSAKLNVFKEGKQTTQLLIKYQTLMKSTERDDLK